MKGFYIYIKNDLLEPKHVEAMGQSVWLYMWLIDHITFSTEDGMGFVLGGKPIKYDEVYEDLGMSKNTYTRWIDKLLEYPYIETTVAPYGTIFRVLKSQKRFTKNGKRFTKNDESFRKNGEPNKTNQDKDKDDTVATKVATPPKVKSFFGKAKKETDGLSMSCQQFILMCRGSDDRHIRLIGEYADAREDELDFHTCGQWREFGNRNLRVARELAPFSDRQFQEALDSLFADLKTDDNKQGFITTWGMETLKKYLIK